MILSHKPKQPMRKRVLKLILGLSITLVCILALLIFATAHPSDNGKPIAKVQLTDGRILQIEGVTYGTKHRIGNRHSELVSRIGPWLPGKVAAWLYPEIPQNEMELDEPALVVWVNALDAGGQTNVDCQGIRVEFVAENGDLYGAENSSWFGGIKFWRVGHKFHAFPRTDSKLALQITSWKKPGTVKVEFPNPYMAKPAIWTGEPLPQKKSIGGLDIILLGFEERTNGSPKRYWETPAVYWEPNWELRKGEEKIGGWQRPEWIAEDAYGNLGKELGVHQPVLKYSAKFYPKATNTESTQLMATMPNTPVTNLQSIVWWNQKVTNELGAFEILGLFPIGNYVFSEGQFLTNPPVKMGAVRGGAPSGWTGQSVHVNPLQMKHYNGHYTTKAPVIYVHAPEGKRAERLALRLRDDQGRYYESKLDSQGTPNGIHAFIVDLPKDVETIVPELVILKPVEAEFMVKTPVN
jgi:hypothetical protein